MAAEKLTKKRLIQILVMLAILLSAFFYRSCHYQKAEISEKQASIVVTHQKNG
ncbi:hypothetical protein [Gallibacterium genomosp. 3]|uniref:hypothetical protein n=1 Tax=Gallibacterium genomosp. 3 TaxID=505345 RepID=UPI000B1A4966|nr:hypothetical protein [Gallibacterium genomosp. 3]